MSPIVNRRQFLAGLTAGAGAATVAASGTFARAALASGQEPKRLLVLSSCHGTVYDLWKMRPEGRTDRGDWRVGLRGLSEAEFSRSLAPLYAHRDRLSVVDGLSQVTGELDLAGYRHEKGWVHAWTGAWVHFTGSDLFSTTPSLDQLVAAEVARPDRLPSLELQIAEGRPICHAGPRQQLPLEADPTRVFNRMFGLADSSDPMVQRSGSILDFALGQYRLLRNRLSGGDQQRLAAHYDLVRQLEERIGGLQAAVCDTGTLNNLARTSEGYTALFMSMADLITAAFSCDMTRVATLSLGDLPSEEFGWGWYLSGDAHLDFAHRIHDDATAAEAMSDYTAQHAAQLAYLIGLLESVPDADGGSLMDHTLIVWGGELGDGWHGYDRYNWLTAGGGWHFDEGTYTHFEFGATPVEMLTGRGVISHCGLPHQHLLVDCARAMGLSVDHVGLPQCQSKDGDRIDLTGGLPPVA